METPGFVSLSTLMLHFSFQFLPILCVGQLCILKLKIEVYSVLPLNSYLNMLMHVATCTILSNQY